MLVTYMVFNRPVILYISFLFTPDLGYACTYYQTDKYLQIYISCLEYWFYRHLVVIFETTELKNLLQLKRISYKLFGNKENRMAWAFSGALVQCSESSPVGGGGGNSHMEQTDFEFNP